MGLKQTVAMVSLGCPKNQVDAEVILSKLMVAGFSITGDANGADVVIVNTCGFIEDAKRESIDAILSYGQWKSERTGRVVVVTGCLAERYRNELRREMPEVDIVLGIGANDDIVEYVERAVQGEQFEVFPPKAGLSLVEERLVTGSGYTAYLKIADGCSHHCTYCAIPMIRGPYRSRPKESILDEAKQLAGRGIREIIVVAQDPTCYGEDLYSDYHLSDLLRDLCRIDEFVWIRTLYTYPERITDALIDAVAEEQKLVPYFDMPVQHVNDAVLRRMGRPFSGARLRALIEKLRRRIPGVVLRTTMLLGFPGETDEQFEELCEFVKWARFDNLGCFAYSREEGTPADRLDGHLPEDVKQKRVDILMTIQYDISRSINEMLVGQKMVALIDGFDDDRGMYAARTYRQVIDIDGCVLVNTAQPLKPGYFIDVTITEAEPYDLLATIYDLEVDQ